MGKQNKQGYKIFLLLHHISPFSRIAKPSQAPAPVLLAGFISHPPPPPPTTTPPNRESLFLSCSQQEKSSGV